MRTLQSNFDTNDFFTYFLSLYWLNSCYCAQINEENFHVFYAM